jgi:hypothetical protein
MIRGVVVKQIKPARFRDEAFRREIRNAMRRFARRMRERFEETTATWEHRVEFREHTYLSGEAYPRVEVTTEDEIYGYVTRGTRPHEIWAGAYTGRSEARTLAFPSMFQPKTQPGVIGSGAGERGGETVFRPYVQHPGTEPRRFDEEISKEMQPWFKREMEEAMRAAAKASGHRM